MGENNLDIYTMMSGYTVGKFGTEKVTKLLDFPLSCMYHKDK